MNTDHPSEPPSPPKSGWPAWVDEWVMPYLENSALWPVWIALIGHVVVGVAGLVVLGWRQALPEVWVVLAGIAAGSAWLIGREWHASQQLGGVTLTVLLGWTTSLVLAWIAETTGLF